MRLVMRRYKRRTKPPYEIYDLARSPLAQNPTQRDLAKLVGLKRDDLRRLANYKEEFITRKTILAGKKERDLAYPTGLLRAVHERLKFHLNKVKQPDYLMSPRKGRSQRDNAARHMNNHQYVCLDIKQFYPSTTFQMVKRWAIDELGMYEDVAGLLAELATVDGIVSFGSPLTPVLVSMVHRPMFDQIYNHCEFKSLKNSLWVDDLTISGMETPGDTVEFLREAIKSQGLRSHKIKFRTGNRAVWITGIGIVGDCLIAPNSMHQKIKTLWDFYYDAETSQERQSLGLKLLSQMGSIRHISGAKSKLGMRLADQMNSLRQHLEKDRKLEIKWISNGSEKNTTTMNLGNQRPELLDIPW